MRAGSFDLEHDGASVVKSRTNSVAAQIDKQLGMHSIKVTIRYSNGTKCGSPMSAPYEIDNDGRLVGGVPGPSIAFLFPSLYICTVGTINGFEAGKPISNKGSFVVETKKNVFLFLL